MAAWPQIRRPLVPLCSFQEEEAKDNDENGEIDDNTWIEQIKKQNRINLGIDLPIDDTKKKDNTFLGLNKTLLMLSGLIIVGAIGYKIYQNKK